MNRMRRLTALVLAGVTCTPLLADSPLKNTPYQILAPDKLQAAITQLNDEDFARRNQAIESIEGGFSELALDLALTSQNDVETQASVTPMLTYNVGVSRWLQEVVLLPSEQRNSQLALARSPEMLKIFSGLFSMQAATRIASVQKLAKFPDLDIDSVLARLIADSDIGVSVAAMDVAWERKPSPLVVDALWNKVLGLPVVQPTLPPIITFRGRQVRSEPDTVQTYSYSLDVDIADIATEVLIHTKAVTVRTKLVPFLAACSARINDDKWPNKDALYIGDRSSSIRGALQLAQHFQIREALPAIYAMATHPRTRQFIDKVRTDPKVAYYSSNRTAAAATFMDMTNNQADCPFVKKDFSARSKLWVVSDERDEDKAVEEIKMWWKDHSADK